VETETFDVIAWHEQPLLGLMLSAPELQPQIFTELQAEHFEAPEHQRIFAHAQTLHNQGIPVNPATVVDFVGNDYVYSLAKAAGHPATVETYCFTIRREAQRRMMMEELELFGKAMADPFQSQQPCEIGQILIANLQRIMDSAAQKRFVSSDAVKDLMIERIMAEKSTYSTGLVFLDAAMDGGLHSGKCYGFMARMKTGKTILASTISYNLSQSNIPHLFICGEMGATEIHQKQVQRHSSLFAYKFQSSHDKHKLEAGAAVRAYDHTCHYLNAQMLTFDVLRNQITSLVLKYGLKGIILDYWQLVRCADPRKNLTTHLDEVAQWLADYCRQQDIFCVVMGQVNREGNARGGDGLNMACDQLYEICRPENNANSRWLEMKATRYTKWVDVGTESSPTYRISDEGTHFEQIQR
jgi:replicative DNA helicase